ncbi:MAG TPA: hypothetical protein DHN33_11375 [Eubacteriaceae bacterium]|nr:hypothetical protein [Eubacteriaceae bacterium]
MPKTTEKRGKEEKEKLFEKRVDNEGGGAYNSKSRQERTRKKSKQGQWLDDCSRNRAMVELVFNKRIFEKRIVHKT